LQLSNRLGQIDSKSIVWREPIRVEIIFGESECTNRESLHIIT